MATDNQEQGDKQTHYKLETDDQDSVVVGGGTGMHDGRAVGYDGDDWRFRTGRSSPVGLTSATTDIQTRSTYIHSIATYHTWRYRPCIVDHDWWFLPNETFCEK